MTTTRRQRAPRRGTANEEGEAGPDTSLGDTEQQQHGEAPAAVEDSASEREAGPAPHGDGDAEESEEGEGEEYEEGQDGSEDEDWEAAEEEAADGVWSGGSDEEDVYSLVNRAAGAAYARQLAQFPLTRDWTPPPMRHELAAELSLRCAAASPRCGAHPLLRAALNEQQGPPSSCAAAATAASPRGSRRRPRASSPRQPARGCCTPSPPPPLRRRLNPAHALLLREARQGSRGGAFLPHQCAHFAAGHRLPSTASRVVDQRPSRGYIGQFTPDGNIFVAAFQHERKIRLYDVHHGWRLVKDIHARGLQWTVTDTALSADNRFLLYSSITPEVHLVNIESSSGVHSVANVTDIHETLDFLNGGRQQRLGIWSLAWSTDGREIVAGTSDPGLRVFDMGQMKTVAAAAGHEDDVNAVAYAERDSPNVIFSGSDDTLVKVWDRRTLHANPARSRSTGVFVGHTEGLTHIDSKGDGRYLISNAKDQTVKLWDLRMMASEKAARELTRHAPSFHWDYRWMDYPGRGRVVQHPNCQAVQTFRGHYVLSTLIRAYWSPAATTGQRFIYSGSYDGRVHIYDAITALPVAKLGGYHQECVRDASWHPYEPMMATVSFDGSVALWEPEVPGEAEAAEEEAAAVAERQRPGSGAVAGKARRRDLPQPRGDQHAW